MMREVKRIETEINNDNIHHGSGPDLLSFIFIRLPVRFDTFLGVSQLSCINFEEKIIPEVYQQNTHSV